MLLVSAVMMSTASFAWFSTNTTATANGMDITVASATNLMISPTSGGSYVTTHDFNRTISKLVPASAVPSEAPQFFWMEKAGDNMVANSSAFGSDSEFAAATENTQYLKVTAFLKAIGENVAGGSITPEILLNVDGTDTMLTTTDSPVYAAFRVLIVYNTTALLYAPVEGADASYKPISGVTTKTPTVAETAVSTYSENGTTKLITSVAPETPYQVDIYFWLEGQDTHCTAANDISLDNLNFSVKFNFSTT